MQCALSGMTVCITLLYHKNLLSTYDAESMAVQKALQ